MSGVDPNALEALRADRDLENRVWAFAMGTVRLAGRLEILREQVTLLAGGEIPAFLVENVRAHENELAARREGFAAFARESLLLDGDALVRIVDPPLADFLDTLVGADADVRADPSTVVEYASVLADQWSECKRHREGE